MLSRSRFPEFCFAKLQISGSLKFFSDEIEVTKAHLKTTFFGGTAQACMCDWSQNLAMCLQLVYCGTLYEELGLHIHHV